MLRCLPLLFLPVLALPAAEPLPPAGEYRADVLEMAMPPEPQAIGLRMQAAMARDAEWFEGYVAQHKDLKPGDILPYHEKMGITKLEYQLFLDSKDKISLRKTGEAMVIVKEGADGAVGISIKGAQLPVNVFSFSVDGKEMMCKFGATKKQEKIDQQDAKSPMGQWKGTQWVIEEGNPSVVAGNDCTSIKFAAGKDSEARRVLYLRAIIRQEGVVADVGPVFRWAGK